MFTVCEFNEFLAMNKKMKLLQKQEMKKHQEKLSRPTVKKEDVATSSLITDDDLTSGLLDIPLKKTWTKVPVVNYGSSSEED